VRVVRDDDRRESERAFEEVQPLRRKLRDRSEPVPFGGEPFGDRAELALGDPPDLLDGVDRILEDRANDDRDGYPPAVREALQLLLEDGGDTCVEDPLLAIVATTSGRFDRVSRLGRSLVVVVGMLAHEPACNTS
jgi:hypothetical protein